MGRSIPTRWSFSDFHDVEKKEKRFTTTRKYSIEVERPRPFKHWLTMSFIRKGKLEMKFKRYIRSWALVGGWKELCKNKEEIETARCLLDVEHSCGILMSPFSAGPFPIMRSSTLQKIYVCWYLLETLYLSGWDVLCSLRRCVLSATIRDVTLDRYCHSPIFLHFFTFISFFLFAFFNCILFFCWCLTHLFTSPISLFFYFASFILFTFYGRRRQHVRVCTRSEMEFWK